MVFDFPCNSSNTEVPRSAVTGTSLIMCGDPSDLESNRSGVYGIYRNFLTVKPAVLKSPSPCRRGDTILCGVG